jgi:hypothetical protein
MEYTVTLSEAEYMAMKSVSVSVEDWIDNACHQRARKAIDDIVSKTINKFLEANIQIPSSKEEIVLAAFENGWVKTAEEVNSSIIGNTNILAIPPRPSSNT